MRIFPGETSGIEHITFLSLNADQTGPNWLELVVGQNQNLDLPWPCYFRLPRFQMVESDRPSGRLTTWLPHWETDNGFPEWRTVYYTPVVRWPTDVNGKLLSHVLHHVTVDLLVVTDPMKERWDRHTQQFPPKDHDYHVRVVDHHYMADISPRQNNLLRQMEDPPEHRRAEAQTILDVISAEYSFLSGPTSACAEMIAPTLTKAIVLARMRACEHHRVAAEARRHKENTVKAAISELDDADLDRLFRELG